MPACSGSGASPAPRAHLPSARAAELIGTRLLNVLVRAPARTRLRVSGVLRGPAGGSASLGAAKARGVGHGRWQAIEVPITRSGLTALGACSHSRVVATVRASDQSSTVSRALGLGPPDCSRFFRSRSFWNQPLTRGARLDPDSAAVSKELMRRVQAGYGSGQPPTINTSAFTPPVVAVPANQARVRVQLDRPPGDAPELATAFQAVPLPSNARPASGSDGELVLWQPASDTLWEFWQLRRANDGWHASWGGRLRHVQNGPGEYPDPRLSWGTAASGLPLAGGLILPHELRQGEIRHVLALGVPSIRARYFASPAQRTDGASVCRHAPVEGARFRLDPNLNIDSLKLPRPVAILARAAQRYGIVLRDQSGAVAFYAQNSSTLARDPYPALFGYKPGAQLLSRFPWARLKLVRMHLNQMSGPPNHLPGVPDLLRPCG